MTAVLTRILADNFRALVNFEFRPGKLCLLLGDNGSGKSSLFEVLALLSDLVVRGRPAADLFQETPTRWDIRDVQRFELDVEANAGLFRYSVEIKHSRDVPQPPVIRSEVVTCNGETLYGFAHGEVHLAGEQGRPNVVFPFQSNQSFLANVDTRAGRLGSFKEFLESTRILQPNPFDMDRTSRRGHLPLLERWCRNLPSYFDYLSDERPDSRVRLEARLREVIPGFLNFKLQRVVGEEKFLLAQFENPNGPPHEFGLLELSEGQRVLLAMYAAIYGMLGSQSLLCFDEPDNFISLTEVQPWLQELNDVLGQRGGQAMIISHHPEVIDYLALDSAWRFERPAGAVVARQLDFGSEPGLLPSEIIARGG